MSKILVNGLPITPEEFIRLQNDPDTHLVSIAPLRYQSYVKSEVERHPNLQNHLQEIGIIPKTVESIEKAPEAEIVPVDLLGKK